LSPGQLPGAFCFSRLEPAVLATQVQERFTIEGFEGLHFTNEDGVVPGHVLRDDITREMSQGVYQKRNTRLGPAKANPEPGAVGRILLGFGKKFGHALLRVTKYVDAEPPLCFEVRQEARILIDTDQNQRRIERDGRE